MQKTKVDDFLIEEIEKKFNSNQPLSQDDINTLLLKSQYNHINHLDEKLNETVEFVKTLEFKFEKLEIKFNRLEEKLTNDMKNLEAKLTGDMKTLEEKLTTDMKNLEAKLTNDMKNLEAKLTGDMKNLEAKLTSDMKSLEDRLTKKIEITIQEALNKNMLLLITILGGFFTAIKIAEMFAKWELTLNT